MRTLVVLTAMASACSTSPLVVEPEVHGYQQKLADANANDHAATAEQRAVHAAPIGYACGDTVLNDQLTTGGLRVTNYMPCWDYEDEAEHAHALTAVQQRTEATAEREAAKGLVETEIAACAHIPEAEREHSPFAHRRSIQEVTPYFENGVLRGARVVFKPVYGLTADWMKQDIRCHQAHVAALGQVPDPMQQDPTLVKGADVTVMQIGGRVVVVVKAEAADQAALALAKAQGKGPTASVAVGPPGEPVR